MPLVCFPICCIVLVMCISWSMLSHPHGSVQTVHESNESTAVNLLDDYVDQYT
jgi:hypothetical protein